jgi:hypothetical protein
VITISADPETCPDLDRLQKELQRRLDLVLEPLVSWALPVPPAPRTFDPAGLGWGSVRGAPRPRYWPVKVFSA